jgi:hypothetical protein
MKNACAANIYYLNKSDNNINLAQGILLTAHYSDVHLPKHKRFHGVVNHKHEIENNDRPLFYFREERFLRHGDVYVETCVRPYFTFDKVQLFLCENMTKDNRVSSHVCYIVTHDVKLFNGQNTSKLFFPLVKRESYEVYRLNLDDYYRISYDSETKGYLKYKDKTLILSKL